MSQLTREQVAESITEMITAFCVAVEDRQPELAVDVVRDRLEQFMFIGRDRDVLEQLNSQAVVIGMLTTFCCELAFRVDENMRQKLIHKLLMKEAGR